LRRLDGGAPVRQIARMNPSPDLPQRNTWLAVKRGLRLRCPSCGKGRLLAGFLKPAASCSACGEPTGQLRSDDGPAWATILIVGHLVSPAFFVFATADADTASKAFFFIAAIVIGATLLLLPRMKGLFMGLMWASRAGEVEPG
jgi:uncharacterized protein (DUF983 family)